MGCSVISIPIGTRPEAIRLYHTVKKLGEDARPVWTGQNTAPNLSTAILRDPRFADVYARIPLAQIAEYKDFFGQFAALMRIVEVELKNTEPEKVLVLGDTNSALASALTAKKLGIPLYHLEAGNRCHNPGSPEEANRRMIDSIADVHLCYTRSAKQNLLSEGVPQNKIHVVGNPMAEFEELHTLPGWGGEYILVTMHRAENEKFIPVIKEFLSYYDKVKLVLHPRFIDHFPDAEPSVNFSNFVQLQKNAHLIVTDSGTAVEEAAIMKKPCLVIRETMERPELLESSNTILGEMNVESLVKAANHLLTGDLWLEELPEEYKYQKVSSKVVNILKGSPNEINRVCSTL